MRELQKQIDAGALPTAPSTTVERWLNYWYTEILPQRNIRPGTKTSYGNTIRLYINPHIGGKRLDKLTPADVRKMITTLQKSKTRRGNAGTRNAQKADQVLRLALKAALKEGLVHRNIMDAVDKPAHVPEEVEPLSIDVVLHLIRTAEVSRDATWATRWLLGIMTGAREAEILGLTWDRVDFDTGLIHLTWQLKQYKKVHGCGDPVNDVYPCGKERVSFCPQAHWDFDPGLEWRPCGDGISVWTRPKTTRSKRGLAMSPPIRTALERLKAADGYNPHGLVFHHADGEPFTIDQDQRAWRSLLKAAGVEHTRQHALRHTAITLSRKAEVDEQTRQELFGHSTVDMQRHYAHSDIEQHQQAMGKLAAMLTDRTDSE